MRDSWGQNFGTKHGRQVALTCCSKSSERGAHGQSHTTPPLNWLFSEPFTFSEVNKCAFKKLVILFILPAFSEVKELRKIVKFHRVKVNKNKTRFKSTVHVMFTEFGLVISRDSAATYVRRGGLWCSGFVDNFI